MKQIIKAFAKLNLLLNILPKKDGESKHQLQSIFCLDYMHYDEIIVEDANALSVVYYQQAQQINISNDSVSAGIVWLRKKFPHLKFNYKITINKHIPIGSGLGGESSDCAAVMNFILKQNNCYLSNELMFDLALNVGSDIGFFLSQLPQAYVCDYGNIVLSLPSFKINYCLAISNVSTSTKEVFACFDKLNSTITNSYSYQECWQIITNWQWDKLTNNLLTSALTVNKELKLIYQALLINYPSYYVLLNGSGSSFLLISKSKL